MENTKEFVHLHLHTEYSLLDGAVRVDDLFKLCKELGMKAVAMTDHGALYGAVHFYKAARDAGIKPIIGCEMYICADMNERSGRDDIEHLVLLCKNKQGYKNLIKMDSLAFIDGFYYKPRIDFELLKKHSEGLICMSACLAGSVPRLIMKGELKAAKELAAKYKELFKDDYYLELMDHGISEQKFVNSHLLRIAGELGIKTVATNDVHYLYKEDAELQEVLMCVQTKKNMSDPSRMKFETDEFYLKSADEMYKVFSGSEESLRATLEIAGKCDMELEFKMKLIPDYEPGSGESPKEMMRRLTTEGLEKKYQGLECRPDRHAIIERAEHELQIIDRMGFNEYYLIVWDFIAKAKSIDIPVGPGRGSGVGSIVAYALDITDVDPLRFSLLFERFLNPERKSMPDFDIDFCGERRGEIIEYVTHKYTEEKVSLIATLLMLKAKAVIKDVARVYMIPFADVNAITKHIPYGMSGIKTMLGLGEEKSGDDDDEPDEGVKKAEKIPELVEIYNSDASIKKVLDMAMRIEGMPRNTSKHAAGVVICKEVLSDYVPLTKSRDDIITQFNKKEVEALGLLKMDFLGLKTLTDIKKSLDYVSEQKGIEINFLELGYEDKGVYELISEGDTDAVFQLESPGMKRFMQQLKPDCLEDVIAGISLYRPGPMDSIPKYVKGKYDKSSITYAHPTLQPILDVTYGCMVYQEQVMQIVQSLAGFTMGQADVLRRAMGSKDPALMAAQRAKFVEGAVNNGIPQKTAEEIFNEMNAFAGYAFNKSHAAAYAVLAFRTAYLKRYHKVEFITAVLNNRLSSVDDIAKYINYCRLCKIEVLRPDVNKSGIYFSVENGRIRFGLSAIKNCGEKVVGLICGERRKGGEFKGLTDFIERTADKGVNKRLLEGFITGGAFDSFPLTRCSMMQSFEGISDRASNDRKRTSTGQTSLFEALGMKDGTDEDIEFVPEFPQKQKLAAEREALGVYITGHPLDNYKDIISTASFNASFIKTDAKEEGEDGFEEEDGAEIEEFINKEVTAAGILFDVRKLYTKSGAEYATAKIEDLYGFIDLIFFTSSFNRNRLQLTDDSLVTVAGKLIKGRDGDAPKIMVDKMVPIIERKETRVFQGGKLFLKFKCSQSEDVMEILSSYPGTVPVKARVDGDAMDIDLRVSYCDALKSELLSLIGEDDIVYKG